MLETRDEQKVNSIEIRRKLLHLVALCIPLGIAVLPRQTALALFISLAGAMFAGEKLRQKSRVLQNLFYRMFGAFLRPEEEHGLTGGTYFFIAGALCLLLFDTAIAYTVISFMIVGDAAAALIGMKFGNIRMPSGKTLEGTLGCVVSCMGFWALFPGVGFAEALAAALLTGLLELIPLRINDNLIVPVLCGMLLQTWAGW